MEFTKSLSEDGSNIEKVSPEDVWNYLDETYVQPCEAIYDLLSERGKEVADFWDLALPKYKIEMLLAMIGTFSALARELASCNAECIVGIFSKQ